MIRVKAISADCGTYVRWYYNGYQYWNFTPAKKTIITEGESFAISAKQQLTTNSKGLNYTEITGLKTLLSSIDAQLYVDGSWVNINVLPKSQIVFNTQVNGYEMDLIFECSL